MTPALPAGWRLDARETVGSTNDEARKLAIAGAPHGTAVWAKRQEAGRGRRGRGWDSPEGNFYCSVVLRPTAPPARAGQLTFVVGLALADAAIGLGVTPQLKWPNDLVVGGAKLAGILLESAIGGSGSIDWVVAGTGMNVASHPEIEGYSATDLAMLGADDDASPERVLALYIVALDHWYGRWQAEGFGPVRKAWLDLAAGVGQSIEVRLERETLHGTFVDLDGDGALVLGLRGGLRRRITAGDVFFGRS